MFKKILVPLDGSKLAECVLSYAEALAVSHNSDEIALISVTENVTTRTSSPEVKEAYFASNELGLSQMVDGGMSISFGKKEQQALRYLERVAEKLKCKGTRIRTEVLIGHPAEEITRFAENEGIDVVVMASHGRSGPLRWAYGSVADKVFRAVCIPILMIRAPGCQISV